MNPRTQITPELRSPFPRFKYSEFILGVERPLIESGALNPSATPTYNVRRQNYYLFDAALVMSILLGASAHSLNT